MFDFVYVQHKNRQINPWGLSTEGGAVGDLTKLQAAILLRVLSWLPLHKHVCESLEAVYLQFVHFYV